MERKNEVNPDLLEQKISINMNDLKLMCPFKENISIKMFQIYHNQSILN